MTKIALYLVAALLLTTFCQTAVQAQETTNPADLAGLPEFSWAGGFEDTFVPQAKEGMRPLEEYELTQHYQQWHDDVDRAAALGITKLRWGIPWYKVEPARGSFDWSWVDEVLDYMVHKQHIDPIVDLVHYGTPSWLQDSFASPDYSACVAEYERAFADRYKDLIRYYTPLNEPTVNADLCGRHGAWPPYLTGDAGYVKILLNIAEGIQESMRAIKLADPDATIVDVEAVRLDHPDDQKAKEEAALNVDREMIVWDLVSGAVGDKHPLYQWLLEKGASQERLAKLRSGAVHADIFGINFYPWLANYIVAGKDGKVEYKPGPDDGRQLADVIAQVYERVHTPLFVTETSAPGTVQRKALWMSETIDSVRLMRDKGIPVVGYTWFPLTDMIEWDYRFTKKDAAEHIIHLGLWECFFDSKGVLERKPTTLVDDYKDYVHRGMPYPAAKK